MSHKVYAASLTESIKSTNSTSPLPIPQFQYVKPKNQLSRDVTTLYELFSNVPTKTNKADGVMCYCCERRITKKRNDTTITPTENEQDRKRNFDEMNSTGNKVTSALYYGSNQVRKYMKKVMTRENWCDLLKNGFPCPHRATWSNKKNINNCHHFCTVCDTDQTQDTLRLTLTPSACRAQDNEIYGEYQQLNSLPKTKKRKGKKKFF